MSNVTGQADHAKGSSASSWWAFLAARRKAIAALLVPLIGGLITLSAAHHLSATTVWGLVATALTSGGVVHQVANAPTTPVGK